MENTKMNENESNWDTKEAYLVLTNNERYFNGIKDNAKTFNGFKLLQVAELTGTIVKHNQK